MRRMMKRTAKAHARPLTFATHCRSAAVLTEDLGDLLEVDEGPAFTPVLTGGDLDADWQRAWDIGDEAVGGSAASREILGERDLHRWDQED